MSAESTHLDPHTASTVDMNEYRPQLHELVRMQADVLSEEPERQLRGSTMLRKLLSLDRNPPIAEVLATGILPRLLELTQMTGKHLIQFEALWAITNLASGTKHHTREVIDAGAIPVFSKLLLSSNDDIVDQALWAIGNISGDGPHERDLVLECGIVRTLLLILQRTTNLSMLRNLAWVFSNLCRGKPKPDIAVIQPIIPAFAKMIALADDDVVNDALWGLSYVSDGPDEHIQLVLDAGVSPRVVELLRSPLVRLQTPALRTCGNLATGSNIQTQVLLDLGILPYLKELLSSPKRQLRKEALWCLSNVAAGTHQQIEAVIDCPGLLDAVVSLICDEDNRDVGKEGVFLLSNALTCGTDSQIARIVEFGVIAAMCNEYLSRFDENERIAQVALDGLVAIDRCGEKNRYVRQFEVNPYSGALHSGGVFEVLQKEFRRRQLNTTWHQAKLIFVAHNDPSCLVNFGMLPIELVQHIWTYVCSKPEPAFL